MPAHTHILLQGFDRSKVKAHPKAVKFYEDLEQSSDEDDSQSQPSAGRRLSLSTLF
jgi:hypothetical protein